MLIVNIHKGETGKVVVVSDKEIVGRKFEEGNLQLDLSKEFYAGEEKKETEIIKLFQSAEVRAIHLTGEKAVGLGKKEGLVEKGKILVVKRVPHAEVCFL